MKKVIFYLIEKVKSEQSAAALLLPHEQLACQMIYQAWKNQQRVLVACNHQKQAEIVDEYLWQWDLNHFVPHNLAGEGPKNGSPVEICWPECRSHFSRHILINLQTSFPDFSVTFNDIVDFVPQDEALKNIARERYKHYKQLGFNIKTIPITV